MTDNDFVFCHDCGEEQYILTHTCPKCHYAVCEGCASGGNCWWEKPEK